MPLKKEEDNMHTHTHTHTGIGYKDAKKRDKNMAEIGGQRLAIPSVGGVALLDYIRF